MITTHINMFDYIILGILGLSCLFAFFRGLVREVLSLVAWVGAGIITVSYFHPVAERLQDHFKNPGTAVGAAIIGLYIASLMGFAIINMIILKTIKRGGEAGMLDNLLGLGFGALRGGLIVSLAYAMIMFTLANKEEPEWLKQSVTRPYLAKGADILAKAAPGFLQEVATLERSATDHMQATRNNERTPSAGRSEEDSENGGGYSRTSGQQLDRLIESTHRN